MESLNKVQSSAWKYLSSPRKKKRNQIRSWTKCRLHFAAIKSVLCVTSWLQRVTQQIWNIIYKFYEVSETQHVASDHKTVREGIGKKKRQ
jgi:hypothetical protein